MKKETDVELAKMTMSFRNNVEQMKKIEGFEEFYKREVQLWFLSQRYLTKPFRDVKPPNRFHKDVTLLIKCCPQDSYMIDRAVFHISDQLCLRDDYAELVLLVDPYEGPYTRQYHEGDLMELMDKAETLKRMGLLDQAD